VSTTVGDLRCLPCCWGVTLSRASWTGCCRVPGRDAARCWWCAASPGSERPRCSWGLGGAAVRHASSVLATSSLTCARGLAVDALHNQLVAAGIAVADGGEDRELDRAGFERAGGAAPDAPAAARGGARPRARPLERAAWEQATDLISDPLQELEVLLRSPERVARGGWLGHARRRGTGPRRARVPPPRRESPAARTACARG
jgi:hypothetical protein